MVWVVAGSLLVVVERTNATYSASKNATFRRPTNLPSSRVR